ncbi:MAG: hypothetical protein M1826_002717 [Phylliscum demangeonii]|nr:MAG: hypothetical protein M1826_002717 [Phylliscum demangeonii]
MCWAWSHYYEACGDYVEQPLRFRRCADNRDGKECELQARTKNLAGACGRTTCSLFQASRRWAYYNRSSSSDWC